MRCSFRRHPLSYIVLALTARMPRLLLRSFRHCFFYSYLSLLRLINSQFFATIRCFVPALNEFVFAHTILVFHKIAPSLLIGRFLLLLLLLLLPLLLLLWSTASTGSFLLYKVHQQCMLFALPSLRASLYAPLLLAFHGLLYQPSLGNFLLHVCFPAHAHSVPSFLQSSCLRLSPRILLGRVAHLTYKSLLNTSSTRDTRCCLIM